MAFLSVVTRCYKRPKMLANNVASVRSQTDPDYQQVFIVDDMGRGVGWANRQLVERAHEATGQYVMVLDDDDMLSDETLIETLKGIVEKNRPELIMAKMDHGELGILPNDDHWLKRPEHGQIGMSAWVASNELYRGAVQNIGPKRAGDVAFYQALYDRAASIYWLDQVISQVQRISWGKPE